MPGASALVMPSAKSLISRHGSLDTQGRNRVALQLDCSLFFLLATEERLAFGHFLAGLARERAQQLALFLRHVRGNIDPDFDNLIASAVALQPRCTVALAGHDRPGLRPRIDAKLGGAVGGVVESRDGDGPAEDGG